MAEQKNTHTSFVLADGTEVEMTLTYWLLTQLKRFAKDAYKKYNDVMVKGVAEELDNCTVLYAGYLCAYIEEHGKAEGAMSEEEFIKAMPMDRIAVNEAIAGLIAPKAGGAS